MRPTVVSLLPRPPHPTRDGGSIRNYHLLRALTRDFRVIAVSLLPHEANQLPWEIPEGVESHVVPLGSGFARSLRGAAMAVLGEPYTVSKYRSADLRALLSGIIHDEQPTWLLTHGYHLGTVGTDLKAPLWIDFHNVDSLIWRRMAATAQTPIGVFARWQARSVERLERRLITTADGVSFVSEHDAKLARNLSAEADPVVVPNGVDLSRYARRTDEPDAGLLAFVGDLRWRPNADGVSWFAREIWPSLRSRVSSARVDVLGRGATDALRSLGDDRFRFMGDADDTRETWRRATVAVVPLRVGGGTRLKILEAAAIGVPVVSTTIGAEGLTFEDGRDILVRDSPAAWVEALANLLDQPKRRAQLADAARARVEAEYDWEHIGARFAGALLARRPASK